MKKRLLIALILLLIPFSLAFGFSAAIQAVIGQTVAGGSSCPSGTFVGGDTETFECGTGEFQTYDNGTGTWAITGVLDTYDNTDKSEGAHSMSLDLAADTAAYVEADAGAGDSVWSVKFDYYAQSFTAWKTVGIFSARATSGDPATTYAVQAYYGQDGTSHLFKLRNQAGTFSSDLDVTPNAWYRIQIDYVDAGNIELSVYNLADTEEANSPQVVAETGTVIGRYFYFGQFAPTAGYDAPKQYWDRIIFKAAGGDIP